MDEDSEPASSSHSSKDTDNKDSQVSEEDYLLGSMTPLWSILVLSFGPMISQLAVAVCSIIESIYVSKAIGNIGVEVFGAIFVVDFITVSIAQYMTSGLGVQVSYLFGKKKPEECAQMLVDYIRLGFLFGIIVPFTVLPLVKPLVKWFGADDALSDLCFVYMAPTCIGSIFTFIFGIACGLVQAEGHSFTYGMAQFISLILNTCLFSPFLLFVVKTGIWGASLSTILSQAVPGIYLMSKVLRGKFAIHPKKGMFLKPFSSETYNGLKLGVSSLLENISNSLPLVLMQKYVNMAAIAVGEYNAVIMTWGIVEKLYLAVGGVVIGFANGLVPVASYAFGAERLNRLLRLTIHALWMATLWSFLVSLPLVFMPRKIAMLWSEDETFLDVAERMIPILFYTTITLGIQYIVPSLLLSMQQVYKAGLLSVLTMLIPQPLFSALLYYTKPDDPIRIMYTYTLNDVYSVFLDVLFVIAPLMKICSAAPTELGILLSGGRNSRDHTQPLISSSESSK